MTRGTSSELTNYLRNRLRCSARDLSRASSAQARPGFTPSRPPGAPPAERGLARDQLRSNSLGQRPAVGSHNDQRPHRPGAAPWPHTKHGQPRGRYRHRRDQRRSPAGATHLLSVSATQMQFPAGAVPCSLKAQRPRHRPSHPVGTCGNCAGISFADRGLPTTSGLRRIRWDDAQRHCQMDPTIPHDPADWIEQDQYRQLSDFLPGKPRRRCWGKWPTSQARISDDLTSPSSTISSSSSHKLQFCIGKSRWHGVSFSPPNSVSGPSEKSTLP